MSDVRIGSAVHNRWLIAAAGVVMQVVLGSVYAWSVFKKPFIEAYGWPVMDVGFTFTLAILFIGLAAAFGGKFVDKAGARKVATLAALLFGAGTLLTGLAAAMGSKILLWVGYGVVGGIGNGLGYITPIAVLVRWFPDKRGLVTGLAVMGFGFGAAIVGQIAPLLIPSVGLANTFYVFGACFLVLLLLAAQYLNNPPADWAPAVSAKSKLHTQKPISSFDLKTALGMRQFYILWAVLFINVTAGIGLISNLSPMAQDQVGVVAAVAGTIIFVSSLFNGCGRIFWASLSDKLGRKGVFMLILGTQVPLFFIIPHVTNVWVFSALACYILACYGGGFATMPAYAAETFGCKHMGRIYGKVLLAWGAAGVVGPMLMEYIKATSGSFQTAIYVAGAMLAGGFLINLLYRNPHTHIAPDESVCAISGDIGGAVCEEVATTEA
ncbi:MAG: OFA family MFS transporter [bacterium]